MSSLVELRSHCDALRLVLLPDAALPAFLLAAQGPFDEAFHQPIVYGAYVEGHLHKLTGPIHRYILAPEHRERVCPGYLRELPERWFCKNGHLARHQASRIYMGKVCELMVAARLEETGWTLAGLEAWGDGADVVASDQAGLPHSIEVKHIGRYDDMHNSIVSSLGAPAMIPVSQDAWANYVISRVYEAARQLAPCSGRKVACIVIDSFTWGTLQFPLTERGRIDWNRPLFFDDADQAWNRIGADLARRFPGFPGDLATWTSRLDEIWLWVLRWPDFETFRVVAMPGVGRE